MQKIILSAAAFFLIIFSAGAQVDRTKMPEPKPAPEIELADYSTFTLSNGLKVIIVENHKLPRITFSLIVDRDPILEKDTAGYISASGQLLRTGTKTRTKDQLDEEIDFIGANISTSSSGASASSLTKHLDKLLVLYSDIIINSDFKQEELEKIKTRMLSDFARSKDNPDVIAGRVASAVRFGSDHPYGESISEESINNITIEKCREYYNTFFRPNISYLAVVGDVTEEKIKPLLEKYLGNWEPKEVPSFSYPVPEMPEDSKVIFVDRANSVQSVINITYPVEIQIGDEDELAATMMNTILGGSAFRLFENLREKHSFTYGAYSSLRKDKIIGSFSASTEVRNTVTDSAITEILSEMQRMREEKVPEDELTRAKNYFTGSFAISLEQPATIARFALNIQRYNLPQDYYSNYLKNVAAVTTDDIHKAAQKYIRPDKNYIVVVGSKEQTASKLSQFGEVVFNDIYGEEISGISDLPEGLSGEQVLEKYIESIGGRENLMKVEDRTTSLIGRIQGMEISMTSYNKAPDKLRQDINAPGVDQSVIYDGQTGYVLMNGIKKELEENELEKIAVEAKINMLLDLNSSGVELKLTGKEIVNGKDSYIVEMKFPSGTIWIQFYDVETGLKVKEIKPVESAQGTFNQETYFDDYREINGVRYPFLLTQTLGAQQIELTVTSITVNTGLTDDFFNVKE